MSVRMLTAVFESELPPRLRIVALAAADDASKDGYMWSSIASIAEKSGYSRRQTITLLQELVGAGAMVRVEPEDLPDSVRSRWESVPSNHRPVPYRLLLGVQGLHGSGEASETDGSDAEEPDSAVPDAPDSGVQHAAPQESPGDVQDLHGSDGSGVQSGVRAAAHKRRPLRRRDTSLRSVSLPAAEIQRMLELPISHLRHEMLSDGWVESSESRWLFTKPGSRPFDMLVAALIEVRGIQRDEIPDDRWSAYGKAAAILRSVDADPHDVLLRARRFWKRKKYRPAPFELATQWGEWGDAADERLISGDDRHAEAAARARAAAGAR